MLEQLLTLKKRREGRLRQQLAAGNQRYERLLHTKKTLISERNTLQESWLRLGQESRGKLARERLNAVQRELEEHFKRDKALDEEIADIEQECGRWLLEKDELNLSIKKIRIEQEKLEWVLNEGIDAY
jgi:hypothetical protein